MKRQQRHFFLVRKLNRIKLICFAKAHTFNIYEDTKDMIC